MDSIVKTATSSLYLATTACTEEYDKQITTDIMNSTSDTMREVYLEILKNKNIADKRFTEIGEEYISTAPFADSDTVSSEKWVVVTVGLDTYVFSKNIISFGKLKWCDIVTNDMECSRLHFLMFILPHKKYKDFTGVCVVADLGTRNGISTVDRTSDEPNISSKINERNLIIFGLDEIVKLKCGKTELTVVSKDTEPKECIICYDNIRQIVLPCNHFTVCERCSYSIDSCPVCKEPYIGKHNITYRRDVTYTL